jgi:heparanase 1
VLDAGPVQPGFHVYAQCLRGQAGGVAVLAINTSRTETRSLEFGKPADRFTLSAKTLDSAEVQLNGQPLRLVGDIPEVRAERVAAGRLTFTPTTITFVAVPAAGNSSCR